MGEAIAPLPTKGLNKWNAINLTLASSQHPFVIWVDGDAVFPDLLTGISSLMEEHEGADLIVDGNAAQWFEDNDFHDGWNTGVFILRNTESSRKFVAGVMEGVMKDYKGKLDAASEACPHPKCKETTALNHLSDQLVIGHELALAQSNQVLNIAVLDWKLQTWWEDGLREREAGEEWPALTLHYSGCNFCRNRTEIADLKHQAVCMDSFTRVTSDATGTLGGWHPPKHLSA